MRVSACITITVTCLTLGLTGAAASYAQTVSLTSKGDIYAGYVRIPRDEIVSQVGTLLGGLEIYLHNFGEQHGSGPDISWHKDGSFVAGIPGAPKEKIPIPEDPFKFPGIERYLKHYIDNVKSSRVVVVPVGTDSSDLRVDIYFDAHGREIRGRCIRKLSGGSWGRCSDIERDIELRTARLRTHLQVIARDQSVTLKPVGTPAFTFDLQIKNWNCHATPLGKLICDHVESQVGPKLRTQVEKEFSARLAKMEAQIAPVLRPLFLARITQEVNKYSDYREMFKDGVPWEVTDVSRVSAQVPGQGLVPYYNFWVRRPAPARADPGPLTILGVELQPFVNIPASSELPFTPLFASALEVACPAQVRLKGTVRSKGRPGQVRYRYRWQHGPLSTVFVAKVASATWNPQYNEKGVLTHYETEVSQDVTVPLPPALGTGSTPSGLKQAAVGASHDHKVRIEIVDGPVSGWKPYHLVCKSGSGKEAPRRVGPTPQRVGPEPQRTPARRTESSSPSSQEAIRTPGAPDLALLDGLTLGTRAAPIPWGETATISTNAASSSRGGRCSFRYRYETTNQGRTAAGAVVSQIRLDAPDGPVLAKDAVPGLAVGGRHVATGLLPLAIGTWTLYVHVDADDQVSESDERNNLRRVRVEVHGNCR